MSTGTAVQKENWYLLQIKKLMRATPTKQATDLVPFIVVLLNF